MNRENLITLAEVAKALSLPESYVRELAASEGKFGVLYVDNNTHETLVRRDVVTSVKKALGIR